MCVGAISALILLAVQIDPFHFYLYVPLFAVPPKVIHLGVADVANGNHKMAVTTVSVANRLFELDWQNTRGQRKEVAVDMFCNYAQLC